MADTLADRIMAAAGQYAGAVMDDRDRCSISSRVAKLRARAALAALVAEACAPVFSGTLENTVCRWTEDEDGVWWSDCGRGWCFNDGGPSENGVRFCQGCSGRIELVADA